MSNLSSEHFQLAGRGSLSGPAIAPRVPGNPIAVEYRSVPQKALVGHLRAAGDARPRGRGGRGAFDELPAVLVAISRRDWSYGWGWMLERSAERTASVCALVVSSGVSGASVGTQL